MAHSFPEIHQLCGDGSDSAFNDVDLVDDTHLRGFAFFTIEVYGHRNAVGVLGVDDLVIVDRTEIISVGIDRTVLYVIDSVHTTDPCHSLVDKFDAKRDAVHSVAGHDLFRRKLRRCSYRLFVFLVRHFICSLHGWELFCKHERLELLCRLFRECIFDRICFNLERCSGDAFVKIGAETVEFLFNGRNLG